ncbi:hypothetical protein D9M68_887810 [compost metagenome]
METLEDLMVGIYEYFMVMIDESVTDRYRNRHKADLGIGIFEYNPQALQLFCILCKYVCGIFISSPLFQVAGQQIKITVECGLRFCIKLNSDTTCRRRFIHMYMMELL